MGDSLTGYRWRSISWSPTWSCSRSTWRQHNGDHKRLELASEVDEISETGRFDMLVRIRAKNLEELHDIVINKIGKINGIYNTETFIDLQKTEKNPTFS